MNYDHLMSVVEGALKRHAQPEEAGQVAPEFATDETIQDTHAYAQDALQSAQDPDNTPFRFDPSVLFPEE